MRAAGALPTEERVKKMTDIQYIWYYRNLLKDDEEDENLMKERIDYLSFFINPEIYKSVKDIKNGKTSSSDNQNTAPMQTTTGDICVNDDFERELREALGGEVQLTELPDSSAAGNANMSKDDFLQLAMQMQDFANQEMVNIDETIDQKDIENVDQIIDDNLDYFVDDDLDYFVDDED